MYYNTLSHQLPNAVLADVDFELISKLFSRLDLSGILKLRNQLSDEEYTAIFGFNIFSCPRGYYGNYRMEPLKNGDDIPSLLKPSTLTSSKRPLASSSQSVERNNANFLMTQEALKGSTTIYTDPLVSWCVHCNERRATTCNKEVVTVRNKDGPRENHSYKQDSCFNCAEKLFDNFLLSLCLNGCGECYATTSTLHRFCRDCLRCSTEGCDSLAQSGGKCGTHGGVERCSTEGCNSLARSGGGGKCCKHGGGARCSTEGCNSLAQSGGKCGKHGGRARCLIEGCDNFAKSGGVKNGRCKRHKGWVQKSVASGPMNAYLRKK